MITSSHIAMKPTFRTFFRIQIIFTSDPVRAITDASGLAGKTVLAKEQDRQTCRSNSTVYS
jgi:hypothetical protein